jgi:uncharacterized protein YcbK (DUF882 family)
VCAFAIVLPHLAFIRRRGDDQWTGIELVHNEESKSRVSQKMGLISAFVQKAVCNLKALVPAAILAAGLMTMSSAAVAQTRALKLYNVHTHEKQTIVFKRNGRYDASGLKKINNILRDWRKNEPTRMDPRLMDLIWEVYQKSGSRDYIHVVCGYRSPGTNAMLKSRSRRSGVAEKSQHMLGKAMDFYIPDVKLSKLREIGMKFQVGGVGFYPKSGSPFVHMDVGGVRAWPRMPRRELARLFPDGKTIHVPAEGGRMPGYSTALADYKRRVGKDSIVIAGNPSNNSDNEARESKSLLAALFSRADEDEGDYNDAPAAVAEEPKAKKLKEEQPAEVLVAKADEDDVKAPVPRVRPAYAEEDSDTLQTALFSTKKNPAEDAMKAALTPQPVDFDDSTTAKTEEEKPEFSDLAQYKIPVPQMLGDRKRPGDNQADEVLTASAESLDAAANASLAGVPVPEIRPEDETQTIVAAATSDDMNAPAPDLSEKEIAALAKETGEPVNNDMQTDQDETASMIDSLDGDDKTDAKQPLAEMASLDMPKVAVTRGLVIPRSLPLDDANDEPKPVRKGGRIAADASTKDSIRVEPKLTENLIAKWALTKGRSEIIAKPVKAPRFVSRTMRQQPTEVYVDGFTQDTAQVDPDRFSGTAVNFMPVKKFD